MIKKVLTIGGSDTWGGGGIQTDLKTFENHGVFGLSVLTCIAVSSQNSFVIRQLPSELVSEQLQTITTAFELSAIKIGLLSDCASIKLVQEFCREQPPAIPIILDPVLAFKETAAQYQQEYSEALLQLARQATLLTPNLLEAALLADCAPITTIEELIQAARIIYQKTGTAVVIKGGSRFPDSKAIDLYYDGTVLNVLEGPRSKKETTNGAGCCFSAAICSCLAKGTSLLTSVERSKRFVFEAIEDGVIVEGPAGNVWHPEKNWRDNG